jgi:hypothetical protein
MLHFASDPSGSANQTPTTFFLLPNKSEGPLSVRHAQHDNQEYACPQRDVKVRQERTQAGAHHHDTEKTNGAKKIRYHHETQHNRQNKQRDYKLGSLRYELALCAFVYAIFFIIFFNFILLVV